MQVNPPPHQKKEKERWDKIERDWGWLKFHTPHKGGTVIDLSRITGNFPSECGDRVPFISPHLLLFALCHLGEMCDHWSQCTITCIFALMLLWKVRIRNLHYYKIFGHHVWCILPIHYKLVGHRGHSNPLVTNFLGFFSSRNGVFLTIWM